MPQFSDIFISYGRADSKAFATQLYERLKKKGYEVWFDQNDIPLGVDYQQEIDEGLERSHNFVFIMSPHAVNSPYCALEVERAVARNKRIIPLLHVDELPRETWQQRNPDGTDEEWADYQEQKLHFGDVRNHRTHPLIGKINWIYGREDIDDFEAAFTGLVSICDRHRDYVQKHTELLSRALAWEANQRRSQFLLVGQDREEAETWLKVRFQEEQLPCLPTALHAEYISESIKNANNMMTQVFLSYASEDLSMMEKVRRSLWMKGITVWTNTTDIQTGEAFQEAIDRGIEQADNLVYLLSPNSVISTYCQYELERAIALHKRIIPILVNPTPIEDQPTELQDLQYIDLTDNKREEDYLSDENQLLRILKIDEIYFQTHKVMLAKAIKWDRQHRNPGILLRGYNLQQAETWLKTAKTRSTQTPTDLQAKFIEESLRQPPADSLDVFVSYSRADSEFARKLNDSLQIFGKLTWFDQESIATSSADFQQEIYRGIEVSDNFLFILSPEAVNSEYCADEVEYAAKLNRRVITVLHRPVNPADLHPELAKVQWLDFNKNEGDFGENFNQLVRILETDREHVHNHTKWSQRALEWEDKERTQDLLLRGSEFAIAQNWLKVSHKEKKKPVPTELQEVFLKNSQDAIEAEVRKEKRQKVVLRSLLMAMTGVAIIAIGATILAVNSQRKAVQGEVKSLVVLSESKLVEDQEFDSLLSGLKAAHLLKRNISLPERKALRNEIKNALQRALYGITEQNRFEHRGSVNNVTISPDGKMFASNDSEGIKLWQSDGIFIAQLEDETYNETAFIHFSQDSKALATTSDGKVIKLWDLNGNQIDSIGDGKEFKGVEFFPDTHAHRTIGTFDGEAAQLWQIDGTLISTLENYARESDIESSHNGKIFAGTDSETFAIKIWRRDGTLLDELEGESGFWVWALSSKGETLITTDGEAIKLRKQNGELITVLEDKIDISRTHTLNRLAVNPKKPIIAIVFQPKSSSDIPIIQLWQTNGTLIKSFSAHEKTIKNIIFSPDGESLATTSEDKTIKLWDMAGNELRTLSGHEDVVNDLNFSPDNQKFVSVSYDGTLKLWAENLYINFLDSHQTFFSEDKNTFATVDKDGLVQIHSMKMGDSLNRTLIPESEGNIKVSLTKDAQTILTTANDAKNRGEDSQWYGPVQLWKNGEEEPMLLIKRGTRPEELQNGYVSADISPDGQTIITTIEGQDFFGPIQVWDTKGILKSTLIEKNEISGLGQETNTWISGNVYLVSKGRRIVTQLISKKSNNLVQIWNENGGLVATLIEKIDIPQDGKKPDISVETSADGEVILTTIQQENNGKNKALVQLWDANGTLISTLIDEDALNEEVYVHLNEVNHTVMTAITSESMKLWQTDGSLLQTINTGIDEPIVYWTRLSPQLSPDLKILAIPSLSQNTITILDVGSPIPLETLNYKAEIESLKFSSDSRMFAAGSFDETIKIWNHDSDSVTVLDDHTSTVRDLSFNADNTILASRGEDDRLILYQLAGLNDWDSVIQKGCDWLSDYLRNSTKPEDKDAQSLCKPYL